MFKRSLLIGITSGVLAGIAGVIYARVYHSSLGADFSKLAPAVRIIASSLFGDVLAAIGFKLLDKILKEKGEIDFNFLFSIISFVYLLAPFAVKFTMDLDPPSLF